MDSPQSVVSPFKNSLGGDTDKQKSECVTPTSSGLSKGSEVNKKEETMISNSENIGVLDVYIHQARDIQNICIYHKQDVYAKLCLTSDPETTVSTKIINGGGKNPVFNDNLSLNVRTVESSLKCEVFMMSRVRNYLEDQLLGFALVPLSEVIVNQGKLEQEFALSSNDMFHSPAGFVELSLAYTGSSPELMSFPSMMPSKAKAVKDLASVLDSIEFPDPKTVNENQMMVSEYYGIPCSETSESLVSSDTENQFSSELGVKLVESFSGAAVSKADSPSSSVSTNGASSSDAPVASKMGISEEHSSLSKENISDVREAESESSEAVSNPIVPEQVVQQQDYVDMYMKSMQQFTESLAKMKLPLDIDNGLTKSENSSSDQKLQGSKNANSRVFYGSRAFF